jgi:hypothetical protein
MTKKRLIIVVGLTVAVASAGLVVALMLPGPNDRVGITKANFDRIEVGTTPLDVERLFGEPCDKGPQPELPGRWCGHWQIWKSPDAEVFVHWADGRVISKYWDPRDSTFVERMRYRFRSIRF